MATPDRELALFLEFLEERIGLAFADCCWRGIVEAIEGGKRHYAESAELYLARLSADSDEFARFVSDVTVTETYFFREEKHFAELSRWAEIRKGEFQTCWSVTSSTGEEALSIAMIMERYHAGDYRVIASDINGGSLEAVNHGRYRARSFRDDGSMFSSLLDQFGTRDEGLWKPSQMIRDRVELKQLNLAQERDWGIPGGINIVFFRNTLIYMPLSVRRRVLRRIQGLMADEGLLFLGSSEVPMLDLPGFRMRSIAEGGFCFIKNPEQSVKLKWFPEIDLEPAESEHVLKEDEPEPVAEPDDGCGNCDDGCRCLNECMVDINAGQMHAAEMKLAGYRRHHSDDPMAFFIEGQIREFGAGGDDPESSYRKALALDSGFWPAWYRIAQLNIGRDSVRSLECFSACRRILLARSGSDPMEFAKLFGGFTSDYILQICKIQVTMQQGSDPSAKKGDGGAAHGK